MNKQVGYFQTLWFFIWGIIKNSGIYKAVRGIYDFISEKWQQSFITNLFRREHFSSECISRSILGRITRSVFTFLSFVSRRCGEGLNDIAENSGIVRLCKLYLHNLLALNLRFIGTLTVSGSAGYIVFGLLAGRTFSLAAVIALLAGAVLCLLNVNVTEFFKGSLIVRFIESALGTEFSFNFFYKSKCASGKRFSAAVIFGLFAAFIAAFFSPLYGAAFLVGMFAVFLILYKVEVGVFAAVFLAPLMPTMAMAGLAILCIGSLLVRALTTKKFVWRFDSVGMLIIIMVLMYLLSAFTSFAPSSSIKIFAMYFVFMMFYFVIINVIKNEKQFFDLLTVFVISGFFVCAYGIAQYVFGWDTAQAWLDEGMFSDLKMRIYSTLGNPNVLGEYILLVLPVTAALFFAKKKGLPRLVYAAIFCVSFTALILTMSRGCWVGFMASAAVFITFAAGKLWGLVLLALPVVPFVLPESIIGRFTSIGDMKDSSTSYRVYIWMGTLALLKDFFISGIGPGTDAFTEVYPFYSYSAIVAPHSHNLFLQITVELGVVGIAVFALLIFLFFKRICSAHAPAGGKGAPIATALVAIASAVTGFLLQGMFDNCFYNYRVFMIFWTVIAFGSVGVNLAHEARTEGGDKS